MLIFFGFDALICISAQWLLIGISMTRHIKASSNLNCRIALHMQRPYLVDDIGEEVRKECSSLPKTRVSTLAIAMQSGNINLVALPPSAGVFTGVTDWALVSTVKVT